MNRIQPSSNVEHSRKPNASHFSQQTMKAYKPVPTVKSAAILFFLFSFLFFAVGGAFLGYSYKVIEYTQRYDNVEGCQGTTWGNTTFQCQVTFDVTDKMKAPVYFYYRLDNFYQNHRRYIKSRSANQLSGKELSKASVNTDCSPIITMKDIGRVSDDLPDGVKNLAMTDTVANPCGLIAKTFFNDTFEMKDSNGNEVFIDETGIIWESDTKVFKKNDNSNSTQWIDVEDGK